MTTTPTRFTRALLGTIIAVATFASPAYAAPATDNHDAARPSATPGQDSVQSTGDRIFTSPASLSNRSQNTQASEGGVYIRYPARMRTGPSLNKTVVGMAYPGHRVSEIKVGWGADVNCPGNWRNDAWMKVHNHSTGVKGWVSWCVL